MPLQKIEQLEATIAEAQDQLKQLKIEVAEKAKSARVFGFLPKAGSEVDNYILSGAGSGVGFGFVEPMLTQAGHRDPSLYRGLFWQTKEEATEFAKALNTFLELRAQPEVVRGLLREAQWTVGFDGNITFYSCAHNKSELSPWFASEDHAQRVALRIGHTRLKQMFRVLSGMK